jgi:hypothetical protein
MVFRDVTTGPLLNRVPGGNIRGTITLPGLA